MQANIAMCRSAAENGRSSIRRPVRQNNRDSYTSFAGGFARGFNDVFDSNEVARSIERNNVRSRRFNANFEGCMASIGYVKE
jgi:hypothetical protein